MTPKTTVENSIQHLPEVLQDKIKRNRLRRQIQTEIADIFLDAWRNDTPVEETIEEVKFYLQSMLVSQLKIVHYLYSYRFGSFFV